MKKITTNSTLIILIILLMSSLQSCNKTSDWQLTGKVNSPQKTAVYLYDILPDRALKLIDSTAIKQGSFVFKGKNTDTALKHFMLKTDKEQKSGIDFLIANGDKLYINVKKQYKSEFSGTDYARNLNQYYHFKQSEIDNLMNFTKAISKPGISKEVFDKKLKEQKTLHLKNENGKIAFLKSVKLPELNSYLVLNELQTSSIVEKEHFNKYANALTKEGKKTKNGQKIEKIMQLFDAYALLQNSSFMNYPSLKKNYEKLNDVNKNSEYGQKIAENIAKLEKLGFGKTPPVLTAKTIEGKDFNLKNIHKKIILLDFWASWCGPCRMENPHYKKLYDLLKDKDFTIVSYSLDTNKTKWQEAVKKDGLTWTNISNLQKQADDPVVKSYFVEGVPANIIIVDGKIAARNLFGPELDDFLQNSEFVEK